MISVVIPMYNESDGALTTLNKIEKVMSKLKEKYEIIAVNDGSSDNTLDVLNNAKKDHKNLRVVSHSPNKGPGAAFRDGFANAKGDIIITLDADLSFSPDRIPQMLDEIKNADVVIGSQYMPGAGMENIPMWRIVVSRIAVLLDRFMLNVHLTSLSSFFVTYRRKAIKSIDFQSNGFDAQCEILTKLYRKGYRIKEIPCVLRWSDDRKNRLSIRKLFREAGRRFKLWASLGRR